METIGAIIAGVLVYVICEYLKEIWLQPIQEYKRLKAEATRLLVYYANLYTSPEPYSENSIERIKASQEFRHLAAQIAAFSEQLYKFHWGIPENSVLIEVSRNLIGISNSFFAQTIADAEQKRKANDNWRKEIKKQLSLEKAI